MRRFCLAFSRTGFISLALLAALVTLSPARAADRPKPAAPAGSETIMVFINQAKVIQLPDGATTVVVGNPAIADVTLLRSTKSMILTGKGYGETNLIALDARGRSVGESNLRVAAPNTGLVVQRGLERETWDCAPRCQPTFMLGDSTKFASEAAGQIQLRNSATAPAR